MKRFLIGLILVSFMVSAEPQKEIKEDSDTEEESKLL